MGPYFTLCVVLSMATGEGERPPVPRDPHWLNLYLQQAHPWGEASCCPLRLPLPPSALGTASLSLAKPPGPLLSLCVPGPRDQSEVLSPCTEKLHPSVLGLRDREGTELALLSILGIKDKLMNVTESTGGQIKEKWF